MGEPEGRLRLRGRFTLDSATAKEEPAAVPAAAPAHDPVAPSSAFGIDVNGDGVADYVVPACASAPGPVAIDVNGDGVADYVATAPMAKQPIAVGVNGDGIADYVVAAP